MVEVRQEWVKVELIFGEGERIWSRSFTMPVAVDNVQGEVESELKESYGGDLPLYRIKPTED